MTSNEFTPVRSRNDIKYTQAREQLIDKNAPLPELLDGPMHMPWLTVRERRGLLEGPKADIYVGDNLAFRGAPIRALMAWSGRAHKHFITNPLSRKVVFPGTKVTAWGIATILKATVTYQGMGGELIGTVYVGNNFGDMVKLYVAGNVLDMASRVSHIFVHMQHLINTNLLSYQEVTAVLNAVEPGDALLHHLARDMANRRFQGRISDPAQFDQYLAKHPTLETAMAEVDAPHEAARKAVHEAKIDKEKREHAAEQKRMNDEYRARVSALQAKINSTKGGILSLSAEEAALKRELGI